MTEVSTWEELVQNVNVPYNEISITADIDANNFPIMSSILIQIGVTINGNGHTIYNIQNGTNLSYIFNSLYDITISNTKFFNIFSTANSGVFSNSSAHFNFVDCEFQGAGANLFRNVNLTRCSCAWQVLGTGTLMENSSGLCQDCYFNCKKSYAGEDTNTVFTGVGATTQFIGCLFEGDVTNNTSGSVMMFNCTSNSTSNVINVKTSGDNAFTIPGMSTSNISIVNTSVMETTPPSVDGVALVNGDQFRDVDYLQSIGFAIIDL